MHDISFFASLRARVPRGVFLACVFAAGALLWHAPGGVRAAAPGDAPMLEAALGLVERFSRELRLGGEPAASAPAGPAAPAGSVRLAAAVSMSLSPDYRRQLSEDARVCGMRLVVRGVPVSEGFEKQAYFAAASRERLRQKGEIVRGLAALHEAFGSVEIDPAFFRRHALKAVPVFVLEDDAGVIARVHGAVSLEYALEALYRETDEGARPVNEKIGIKRLRKARAALVRAGCALRRGRFVEQSFAGESCE